MMSAGAKANLIKTLKVGRQMAACGNQLVNRWRYMFYVGRRRIVVVNKNNDCPFSDSGF